MITVDPALFLADLEAKPAALRDLADRLTTENPWSFLHTPRRVIFVGMGSSRYAAEVAARRLRVAGIDAAAEYASAEQGPTKDPSAKRNKAEHSQAEHNPATHGQADHNPSDHSQTEGDAAGPGPAQGGLPSNTLVIAISATGKSRETLDAVTDISDFVALTNDATSPLVQRATHHVDLRAGPEKGGVACRSFQHTQLLLDALINHLTGTPAARSGPQSGTGKRLEPGTERRTSDNATESSTGSLARRTAEATEDLLERRDAWLPACSELLAGGDGIFPMAPVERLSSALQSALMFREGPRVPADGCETGDWSHVDVYLTKTLRYRALLFPGSRYDAQALEWLHTRKSTVVAVGGEVPGAALAVRFRHDDDLRVRLQTETLIAELVAADWWLRAS